MSTTIVPVLSKGFGGTTEYDNIQETFVSTDNVGNVFICGSFIGNVDFGNGISLNGSLIQPSIYLVKYNNSGIPIKAIKFDTTSLVGCTDIKLDSLGNVYIIGYFQNDINFDGFFSLNTTSNASYIVKIDNDLTPIKAIKFDSNQSAVSNSLVLDTLDNIYVVGSFSNDISFNGSFPLTTTATIAAGYIVKLDNNLTPINAIKFDCTTRVNCIGLIINNLGILYVIGIFNNDISFDESFPLTTNATVFAGYTVKLDNSLTPIKAIKFDTSTLIYNNSLGLDTLGNVYVTGVFLKNIDFGNGTVFTNNLEVIPFSNNGEGYVVKLNQDLIFQTAIPINTTKDNSNATYIIIDSNNNVYLLGNFNGTVDFNGLLPLSDTTTFLYSGYIALLNSDLVPKQSIAFNTNNSIISSRLTLFNSTLYASGTFSKDINFDNKFPLTATSFYSGYFIKFDITTPTTTTTTTTTTEPICLPAGTPILTDQGLVPIDKIDTSIHTINNKRIVAITKTITPEKHLVCFEKYTLGLNIPSQRTLMTPGHEVLYKGRLVQAKEFIGRIDNVYTVPYTGEVLYNVLQEKHGLMKVNNMTLETLNPINKVAKKILSEQ